MTFAEIARGYAEDIVAGRIPACREVRQACQRHLDDLSASAAPDYAYRFDETLAERACAFQELLPHTKGDWAARGETIILEPWQVFIVASLFGWVRKSDGMRRFTEAYLEVPRKNAKSTLAAGIGLKLFADDGEHGAEVYSGATSKKQAWEIFRPAKQMVDKTDDLREAFGIEVHAESLSTSRTNARFAPVIGKPGDGASPSGALIDEFHEHQTPDLYDTMKTGMGARRQPLLLIVTTAGFDLAGPCYQTRGIVQQMLSGVVPNDHLFGIIYTIDEDDDWQDPAVLVKANPNYGVSAYAEYLVAAQQEAIKYANKTNAFLTKHLNKWVSARSAWLNVAKWRECARPDLRIEDLTGATAFIGIDLASKSDIAAVAILLKDVRTTEVDGRIVEAVHWRSFVRSYLPEAAIEDAGNNRAAYERWRRTGHLIVTDGNETNFDQIREDVRALARQFDVQEIAYDPWRATHLAQQLQADGATVVEIRNTVQNLSPAMREMEAAVNGGRWEHPDDPCLNWQVSNVVCREDANRNIFPRKERAENKIDGALAILMALCRAQVWTPVPTSIYETRGIIGFG